MKSIQYQVERSGGVSFDVYQVVDGQSRYLGSAEAFDEQDAINTVLMDSLDVSGEIS